MEIISISKVIVRIKLVNGKGVRHTLCHMLTVIKQQYHFYNRLLGNRGTEAQNYLLKKIADNQQHSLSPLLSNRSLS
jgi:hypothetical protein